MTRRPLPVLVVALLLGGCGFAGCLEQAAAPTAPRPELQVFSSDGGRATSRTVAGSRRGRRDGLASTGLPAEGLVEAAPTAVIALDDGGFIGLDRGRKGLFVGVEDGGITWLVEGRDAGTDAGLDPDTDPSLFANPRALTRCPDGSFWLVDSSRKRLVEWLPPDRIGRTIDGRDAGFGVVRGLTCDAKGALWAADPVTHVLWRQSPTEPLHIALGMGIGERLDGPGDVAQFDSPVALALDRAGTLFVGERDAVRRIGADGAVQTVGRAIDLPDGGTRRLGRVEGLAVDDEGVVWLALPGADDVVGLLPDGGWRLPDWHEASGEPAHFRDPMGIAWDGVSHRLLVAGPSRGALLALDPVSAQVVELAPASLLRRDEALLDSPNAILAASDGALWVVESNSRRLRRIEGGRVTTLVDSTEGGRLIETRGRRPLPGTLLQVGEEVWVAFGPRLEARSLDGALLRSRTFDFELSGLAVHPTEGALAGDAAHRSLVSLSFGEAAPKTVVPGPLGGMPSQLRLDSRGRLVFVLGGRELRRWSVATGMEELLRAGPEVGDGRLGEPTVGLGSLAGLELLSDDVMLVSDGHRIRRLDLTARTVQTVVGKFDACTADGAGRHAHLNAPQGLSLRGGQLFIADRDNHRIRAITLP